MIRETLRQPNPQPNGSAADGVGLFLVSFLLLFFELTMIRWIPANLRIVAYFSNLMLVSCFLGFGLGCILKRRRDIFPLFPPLVLLLLFVCRHFSIAGIADPTGDSYFFAGGARYQWLVAVPVIFVLNALPFVCIGQKLSAYLDRFRALPGYTINIAGSLVGTTAFAAVSFLELTPIWWFTIAFACAIGFYRSKILTLAISAAILFGAGTLVFVEEQQHLWSPYYKIDIERLDPESAGGQRIIVNHDYHQLMLDLSGRWAGRIPDYREWQLTYDFPYLSLGGKPPTRVLVLGAGAGNDVAAALRNRVEEIDAVELDPEIYRLGVNLHPERPYDDARVHMHLNDARNFLRRGALPYDLIVLGWLDSHRLFSSFSNVRPDNFVYTVEAAHQMRDLLRDDGVLCLSFYAGKPWIKSKIFQMLRESFGHDPRVFACTQGAYGKDGVIFMIAKADHFSAPLQAVPGFEELTADLADTGSITPPTDNWPYLYVKDHSLAWEYLSMMLVILALASLMVVPVLTRSRIAPGEGLHFFFLGAGFLLLEVRNITLLALIFGSTWATTSIVISAVLVMILLANYVVEKGLLDGKEKLVWTLLFTSIVLSLVWNENLLPGSNPISRGLITTAVVSLTFFFAGIVFAQSFRRVTVPSAALGANVLGAVVGGMLEYVSIATGISGLSWIALGLYGLAVVAALRWNRSGVFTEESLLHLPHD